MVPINNVQPSGDPSLQEAMQRWCAGDFIGCLHAIEALGAQDALSETALILKARALLRLERADDVLVTLTSPESFVGVDERASAAMLRGAAYGRKLVFSHAFTEFTRARNLRPHKTIVAETAYFNAVALYQLGDVRAARRVLQDALKPSEDIIYARALHLSGLILDAEEKFADAAKAFERAQEALERCRATDLGLRARIAHMLAVRQAEGIIVDPDRLLELVKRVPWTSATVLEHVQALRHIGLAYQRQDDFRKAGECFAKAAMVAPHSALAAMSLAECAWNAVLAGEWMSADSFKDLCLGAVQGVDWSVENGEARFALVDVAMLLARLGNGTKAQRLMTLFDKFPGLSTLHGLAHDSRAATFTRHAHALVAAASGDKDHALQELRAVDQAWTSLQHQWRALEARSDALRLRPDRALEASIKKQRMQLLSRRRETPTGETETVTTPALESYHRDANVHLSSVQRKILKRFVKDLSTQEIATQLGYTDQYIRQQFRLIYPRFGLTDRPSRSQLLARVLSNQALKESLAKEA